jgi:Mn-containing catalase
MIEGTTFAGDRDITPMQNAKDKRVTSHFIETAQSFYPMSSMGAP